ncbi:peptidylprolyl isomerase [Roseateles sp. P5_E7]
MTSNRLRRRPLLALTASLLLSLAACGGGGGGSSTPTTPTPTPVVLTVTHKVRLTTSQGVIELGLDRTHAPLSVDNFLKYVNDGFYNGTVFHRVIAGFVIQGGGVARNGAGALQDKTPTYGPIALESLNGLSNVRGTLAMARTAVPDSATSQFYINVVDNTSLNYQNSSNPGYAVFGQVTLGLDVVDKIKAVSTNASDVPLSDVTVTEAKVIPL